MVLARISPHWNEHFLRVSDFIRIIASSLNLCDFDGIMEDELATLELKLDLIAEDDCQFV